jgi:hypothetical protein
MKPTHLVLVIMGVLIAVIGVTALAGPPIARMLNGSGDDGRITIAIATAPMLAGMRQVVEEQAAAAQQTQGAAQSSEVAQATSSGPDAAPPPQPAQQTTESRAHGETAMMVRNLEASLQDALGNELAQRLIESRRFEVRDSSQFMSALNEISRRAASEGEQRPIFEIARFWERRREKSAPGQNESVREGEAALQQIASFSGEDLRGAGRALNADYVLVIAVEPGSFRHEHVTDPYSSTMHHDNRWQPTVIFRVFNVATGNVVVGGQEAVSPAIVVREDGRSASEIANELQLQLNDRVAEMVTGRLMSVLAPARIVSTGDDTITINRGRLDGVREGQIYEVEREQLGGVRDVRYNAETGRSQSGPTLETIRDPVGQLRILTAQDNIATAAPVEGELARGDIVVITPSTTRALTAGNTGGGNGDEIPLGEGQAAGAGARASLAVGSIRVELLEPPNWRRPVDPPLLLSRGIAGHLVQSGQVNILTRSDIDRLREERQLMARSQGIQDADVDLGLATAGNLLTGELQISATQRGETISVGGQARQTTTAWRLIATGAIRVQTTDGRTIYSVPVRTERPGSPQDATAVNNLIDAAAADAAAALLVRMFPIRVTSVSGNSVVLNRGPEAGLREGARLAAYRVDPSTRTRQRLGELIVTDAAAGYNASARFAAQPFNTDGTVEVEIISGGAAPRARTARAPSQPQEPQPSQVQW